MDRKYWSFVIPALEPDFATAVKRLEDRGLAGVDRSPGIRFAVCTPGGRGSRDNAARTRHRHCHRPDAQSI